MEANLERAGSGIWSGMEANEEQNGSESGARWKRIWRGMTANLEQDASESGAG